MPQPNTALKTDDQAEIQRLRGWLTELSNVKGDNSLSEILARKVRYIARRALAGDRCD